MFIIDGNNWFRRRAETCLYGNPLRSCFNELQNITDPTVILVWDGFNSRQLRSAIYPEYKLGRKPGGESIYEYQKNFKKIARLSRAIIFELDGVEADDIIAALTNRYRNEHSIIIESNDADFVQLGVKMTRTEFAIPPKWITLYKTLVGDLSDNIKGMPKFGKGTWEKLTEDDRAKLLDLLQDKKKTWADVKLSFEFKPSLENFINQQVNLNTLRMYYEIVNFIPIDMDRISKSMVEGLNRPDLAEEIFKEYMC